jgi:biotin carboxyl carrier protein
MTMTPARSVRGEQLEVSERVILAPAVGVFNPVSPRTDDHESESIVDVERHQADHEPQVEGTMVTEGEVVGVVEVRGQALPVRSAFTGALMGMLAHPGERVREGQPVAWLRVL